MPQELEHVERMLVEANVVDMFQMEQKDYEHSLNELRRRIADELSRVYKYYEDAMVALHRAEEVREAFIGDLPCKCIYSKFVYIVYSH